MPMQLALPTAPSLPLQEALSAHAYSLTNPRLRRHTTWPSQPALAIAPLLPEQTDGPMQALSPTDPSLPKHAPSSWQALFPIAPLLFTHALPPRQASSPTLPTLPSQAPDGMHDGQPACRVEGRSTRGLTAITSAMRSRASMSDLLLYLQGAARHYAGASEGGREPVLLLVPRDRP